MRPALTRRLLMMTLLLVSLTLFATTLGAMRLPLASLLPAGDEMLRHIWLTIRLPRVLLALLVGAAPRWRWPAGWCSRFPHRG